MPSDTQSPPRSNAAQKFAQLEALKPKLDNSTDLLNESILAVEKALAALKVGVAVSVCLWSDEGMQRATLLVFRKYGGEWRLVIEWHDGDDGATPPDTKLLVESPRETRLEAVEMFWDLLDAMDAAVMNEITRVERANVEAASFAEFVRTRGKSPKEIAAAAAVASTEAFMKDAAKLAKVIAPFVNLGQPHASSPVADQFSVAKEELKKKGGGK